MSTGYQNIGQTRPSRNEDFAAWAFETADLIEHRRFDEVDVAALVEEARGMARSEYGALRRQLRRLLIHLLKWEYQTERQSIPRQVAILSARHEIDSILKLSPSLHSELDSDAIGRVWKSACKRVIQEVGLLNPLPENCPWEIDTQILNPDWLP